MVLKKSKKENSTLFIDATNECLKVTNNNKLTETNITNIIEYYTNRKNEDYISLVVDNEEIAKQDYSLSVSTYVEKEDTREVINITDLNTKIKKIVAHEDELRTAIDYIVSEIEGSTNE
jgi:type I restriction enzyme M protein